MELIVDKVLSYAQCRTIVLDLFGFDQSTPFSITDDLIQEFMVIDSNQSTETPFAAQIGNYIIASEDLEMFTAIKDAIVVFASSEFVFSNMELSALVGLCATLIQVIRKLRSKGVFLERLDLLILTTLKASKERLPLNRLCHILNKVQDNGDQLGSWSEDEVEQILLRLSKTVLLDGSVKGLVDRDAEGHWGAISF